MVMKAPFGVVTPGKFGRLAYGPPSTGAYNAFGKLGAGKVAAAGAGSKLLSVLAVLLVLPIGSIVVLAAALFSRRKGKKQTLPPPPTRTIAKRRKSMGKLITGKIVVLLLAIVTAGVVGISGSYLYNRYKTREIVIAAGTSKAESFILMQAVKTVAARYYPNIKITVHETGGTTESLQRLDKNQAQFAAAQADVPAGANARTVAVLFNDAFQLLAHKSAPIAHFAELKGKRMALARSGGQYKSFLFVAGHFGLKENDFTFVGGDDEAADVAFARGEADALFRVRALHNAAVTHLVNSGNADLVPIEDASAMRVEAPAYEPATIPKGTYLGNPPVPSSDIATVSTQRLLLARADVDNRVVYAITQVLMDRRQEVAAAIPLASELMRPLAAHIAQPVQQAGMEASLHPGASIFYNHEQTGFVVGHEDLIALIVLAFLLITLWVAELRRTYAQGQKHRADFHVRKIVPLLEEAQDGAPDLDTKAIRAKLNAILLMAISDLEEDRLSEESFRSFQLVWQIAMDTAQDKHPAGISQQPIETSDTRASRPATSRWRFSRYLQKATS